jgi:2-C-methyl-D-erythritol 4-phosphate cytidylyltransferase
MKDQPIIRGIPFDAIIVAGGAGTRLGHSLPKAFITLAGKQLFIHSLEKLEKHPLASQIFLVVPAEMVQIARDIIAMKKYEKKIIVLVGGQERWQSVQIGVNASSAEWILVHDAARPFVSNDVINAVLDKTSTFDAITTATKETDTIRTFENDRCIATVDRLTLIRIGTPQLFRRSILMDSYKIVDQLPKSPTDEAMLMEKMGIPIGFAWGDPINFKITTKSDLQMAEALFSYRSSNS